MTKEDIESLGWFHDKTSDINSNFIKFGKGNYMLGYDFKNNKLGLIVADLSKDINFLRTMNDPSVRNLTIKTKEELTVLMKQFGINE